MFTTRTCCPACASDKNDVLVDIPFSDVQLSSFLTDFYQSRIDMALLAMHRFTVCECQHCSLVYQKHILDDAGMAQLYSQWISASASLKKRQCGSAKTYAKYAAEAETICRILGKSPHETRVLEFGMGWGYWSRMASAFNYQVTGIELSAERIQHARSLGVTVASSLEEIESNSIDFIYANQVLEHVPDPTQIITELRNRLVPAGVMLIRVPDGSGSARQIRKSGWNPTMDVVHPLEHINTFDRGALVKMGQSVGLQEIHAPLRLSCHNPSRFIRSVMREIKDRYIAPHVYFSKMH